MLRSSLMIFTILFVAYVNAASLPVEGGDKQWPQAGGPNGSWSVDASDAPIKWSGARNEGIVWRTALPEEGQSGIAVWGERMFLTTLKPEEGKRPNGRDVVAYCIDTRDGKILWTAPLTGSASSVPAYFFSDASSPTPVTDGQHVWFFNACGSMGCYDFDGKQIWQHEWKPTVGRPFNKQFEPILVGNAVLNMEPRDPDDPKREKDAWNYVRGIDKLTGKTLWISEDAVTHYNTPVIGSLADGTPALLQGRGAYHGVPETPVGLSLTSLAPGREGKTIWRYETSPKGKAMYTQHFTTTVAPWIDIDNSAHIVLDTSSGKVLRTQSLTANVDWRRFDSVKKTYDLHAGVDLAKQTPAVKVYPAQFCNIIVGGWHWFLCYTEAAKKLGPAYCVGRVNLESGKVEYLELPVSVVREPGKEDALIWGKPQVSSTVNSRGIDIVSDKRSQGDGWYWGFLGGPTAVGGTIYFTTMLGITYAIDGTASVLDEKALLAVNDLGTPGQTWSLNSISYARGRLYHRSMKEVFCIGKK